MTRFDLLGHGLQVEGAYAELVAWLKDYWGFSSPNLPSAKTPVKLSVIAKAPPDYPADEPSVVSFHEGDLACVNHDPIIWLGDALCGVRLDLGGDAELELWGADVSQFAMLHIALTEVLRVKGFLPLHAAVAVKDGEATAFLGPSGTGKTTMLLTAVKQGWQALCEDFMWLEPTTLQVYRWDRGVRLLPDTAERFSDLVGHVPTVYTAGKQFIRYRDLGWTTSEGVLTRLRWLERREETARPQPLPKGPLSRTEATRLLWEAAGVPVSKVARENTSRTIPQLLTRVCLERFSIGGTPLRL